MLCLSLFCPKSGTTKSYLEEHVHDEDLVTLASECIKCVRQSCEDADENAEHPAIMLGPPH